MLEKFHNFFKFLLRFIRSGNILKGHFDFFIAVQLSTAFAKRHYPIAAALSLLPVTETFYRMAPKGYSLEGIARELNRRANDYLPSNRFVALLLVIYSPPYGESPDKVIRP